MAEEQTANTRKPMWDNDDVPVASGDIAASPAFPEDAPEQESISFRVAPSTEGKRLDVYLAGRFPERSRMYFQRCIRDNCVRLNGKPCRPADRLKVNDLIEFTPPPDPVQELTPEHIPLEIIYEDESVIVLNKPPGLVVHPARGHWTGTLVHGLLGHDEASFSSMPNGGIRPGIVHRLDRDTSGVMVVAKNEPARLALAHAFAERRVEKTYLAIVVGEFGAVTGVIAAPIGRHPRDRLKMAVVTSGGKPAVSRYRVLAGNGELSLLEVRIETGRTHQIRVHFAHILHPVLGDPMYGGRRRDVSVQCNRQMLHAWKLVFPHPDTGMLREYRAPPPKDFQEALETAGFGKFGCLRDA
jgi:23S rRNA pseudouridine1911/1915/1917 synthase